MPIVKGVSLIWGKKTHKMADFQYKKLLEPRDFLPAITVLDMSKISNNIDFAALLVFVYHQILSFSPF